MNPFFAIQWRPLHFFMFFSWLLVPGFWFYAYADMQSGNYKIESESPIAGGGYSISSTNYKIEEGTIDWFANSNMTSANYKVDAKIAIADTPNIPFISATHPGDFARYFTDQSASFIVTASTPSGHPLTYQAKQDGTSKAGPQASNVLTWALGISFKGRRALDFIVSETNGTVIKQSAMYVYRRPVK